MQEQRYPSNANATHHVPASEQRGERLLGMVENDRSAFLLFETSRNTAMYIASLSNSLRTGFVRVNPNSACRSLGHTRPIGVRAFAAMTASPAFDV